MKTDFSQSYPLFLSASSHILSYAPDLSDHPVFPGNSIYGDDHDGCRSDGLSDDDCSFFFLQMLVN